MYPRLSFKRPIDIQLAVFLTCLFLSCHSSHKEDSLRAEPLNVLFISIDDLNDWLTPLGGHEQVKSPNIDRLVSEGMLFNNAHSAAPLCNPSRAALMTGVAPDRSGIYYNLHHWRESEVLKDALTIPQYFMKNGYYAAGAGKIFHNKWPDPKSWNDYWPGKTRHMPRDPRPARDNRLNRTREAGHFDWAPLAVKPDSMGDMKSVNWVVDQLQKEHDKPFFLACGIYRPHLPWYVPQEFFDLYPLEELTLPEVIEDDLKDLSDFAKGLAHGFGDPLDINTPDSSITGDHENILKRGVWKEAIRAYLASISFADYCLGELMKGLDNSRYKDNTVVVLWSDHGYHLGEKEHWRKETLWEEATRNLLFIRAPGITTQGSSTDWPVSLLDIYPTLVDICQLPEKKGLDGNSLIDLLKEPAMEWDRHVSTTYGYKNHAVRSRDYRFIRYRDGSEEFYDHTTDPHEWHNRIDSAKYREVIADLKESLPKINKTPVPFSQ